MVCMTTIYCADRHGRHISGLCHRCAGLMSYAEKRLLKCPYGQSKPTCAKCPVHCYKKQPRESIRQVMRYAGPRMVWRHPWRALVHKADNWRRVVALRELRDSRNRK